MELTDEDLFSSMDKVLKDKSLLDLVSSADISPWYAVSKDLEEEVLLANKTYVESDRSKGNWERNYVDYVRKCEKYSLNHFIVPSDLLMFLSDINVQCTRLIELEELGKDCAKSVERRFILKLSYVQEKINKIDFLNQAFDNLFLGLSHNGMKNLDISNSKLMERICGLWYFYFGDNKFAEDLLAVAKSTLEEPYEFFCQKSLWMHDMAIVSKTDPKVMIKGQEEKELKIANFPEIKHEPKKNYIEPLEGFVVRNLDSKGFYPRAHKELGPELRAFTTDTLTQIGSNVFEILDAIRKSWGTKKTFSSDDLFLMLQYATFPTPNLKMKLKSIFDEYINMCIQKGDLIAMSNERLMNKTTMPFIFEEISSKCNAMYDQLSTWDPIWCAFISKRKHARNAWIVAYVLSTFLSRRDENFKNFPFDFAVEWVRLQCEYLGFQSFMRCSNKNYIDKNFNAFEESDYSFHGTLDAANFQYQIMCRKLSGEDEHTKKSFLLTGFYYDCFENSQMVCDELIVDQSNDSTESHKYNLCHKLMFEGNPEHDKQFSYAYEICIGRTSTLLKAWEQEIRNVSWHKDCDVYIKNQGYEDIRAFQKTEISKFKRVHKRLDVKTLYSCEMKFRSQVTEVGSEMIRIYKKYCSDVGKCYNMSFKDRLEKCEKMSKRLATDPSAIVDTMLVFKDSFRNNNRDENNNN